MMPRLAKLMSAFALAFHLAHPVQAACKGENLFDTLDPARLAEIEGAAATVPFPEGNFWQATRGDEVITIAGTYHLEDPRHTATLAALTPFITKASTVLVEAGPQEKQALLDLMAKDPSKMLITEGPLLNEQLPPEIWEDLSQAMSDRGIPGFMAAKFKPWYLMAALSLPPCAMERMKEPKGLDALVIDTALAANVPVRGLEPFDTVFTVFEAMPKDDLTRMMKASLLLEAQSEDYFRTLADSYFLGESRKIWELMRFVGYAMPGYSREEVDADFRIMEEIMINQRNRAWIPVLTGAAKDGPVFAAFGALHLSGQAGVLNLLQAEGFTIRELPL